MKTYHLAVPAGIGDWSWLWSKLSTIPDTEWIIYPPDCFPERTSAYIKLLPKCKVMLGQHTYPDILCWGNKFVGKTWAETLENTKNENFMYLQINEHLGHGRPLATWMPDLATDYHYPIHYKSNLKVPEGPYLAFHTASIRGIRAYNAWMPETWVEFLLAFRKNFPDWKFLAMGGFWDLDTIQEIKGMLPDRFPLIDLVGKTEIQDAIKILKSANYYIGFSSGLNCICNVIRTPCTTLWPKPQTELMYSWPDPEMIKSRDYMGFLYDSADRIFLRIKPKIKEINSCLTVATQAAV
jgi:ADP-heptose:LPS heptosyltransferase